MDTNFIISLLSSIGAFSVLVSLAAVLFGKFLPKQKTFDDKIAHSADIAAIVVDKFIGRFIKNSDDIDKIEESIIVTVAYWIENWFRRFSNKLSSLRGKK